MFNRGPFQFKNRGRANQTTSPTLPYRDNLAKPAISRQLRQSRQTCHITTIALPAAEVSVPYSRLSGSTALIAAMRSSLLEYFIQNAEKDGVAVRHRPRLRTKSWTYAEMTKTVFRFTRELENRRIGKGDRVVLWSENSPEWVAAFFGIILRQAVAVPLDEHSTPEFAAKVLEQTEPKLVLIGRENDADSVEDLRTLPLYKLVETISNHSATPVPLPNADPKEIVEIVFTSGTTATPKGVVLTHENILANLEPIEREIKKYLRWKFLIDPLKIVCALPLSHVFGQMMAIFVPQILGATVVFQNRLNPSEIISTIKREKAMVLAAVPRVLETLQHKIESEYDLRAESEALYSSIARERSWFGAWWKYRWIHQMFGYKFLSFVTGGASLDESVETLWRRLGFAVVQGYGMTETAALISLNNPFSARKGSLGQLLGRKEDLTLGKEGEILVRGRSVSSGYWGSPDNRDEDAWFATGDIAELDESGRLYFKGRRKDVIVTAAGLNIFPGDLETALNSEPEVIQSAVVGIDLGAGPEPAAALIVRTDTGLPSLIKRVNSRLAPFQRICHWIEWPDADFPRTPTQKVRKNLIAETITAKLKAGEPDIVGSSWLAGIIAKYHRTKKQVLPESRLSEDLNLDSLSRVELISELEERYQVDLDDAALTPSTTVGELEKMVRSRGGTALERYSYPRWQLRFPFSWIRPVFYELVIYPITRVLAWVRTEGVGNLRDIRGPAIFVSNHVTYVDPALIMSAMPRRFRRRLAVAMDGERLRGYLHPPHDTRIFERIQVFFTYWLVVIFFNAFPLPRRSGFRESFSFAGEAMDRGYNILIFPEGELTKDGNIQAFKSGIGLLASGLEVSVVPLAISGLYTLVASGQRGYARRHAVTVRFGSPIVFAPDAPAADIAGLIEERVRELSSKQGNERYE